MRTCQSLVLCNDIVAVASILDELCDRFRAPAKTKAADVLYQPLSYNDDYLVVNTCCIRNLCR